MIGNSFNQFFLLENNPGYNARILLFLSIEIYHNENFNLWKSHICIPKSIKYLSKKKKKKVRSKNNITSQKLIE